MPRSRLPRKKADGMTAWRIEGTLREFARFDPVNLWFDYPVHKLDTGLLEDLQPDSEFQNAGQPRCIQALGR